MKKRTISLMSSVFMCIALFNINTALAKDESVKGDVNADGKFTVADVVLFKKWLDTAPNAELSDWKAADFCEDEILNLFDLNLMKSKLIEKYGLTVQAIENVASNSENRTPGAVHTTLKLSYDEAKARFGYPIEKCTRNNFIGYKVGIVSKNGNTTSEEAFCLDITYEFNNGIIYIADQNRSAGKLANPGIEYDYLGRTFVEEISYDDNLITIGYYPTEMNGIAYRASFDKSVDIYEIMDLIISIEI